MIRACAATLIAVGLASPLRAQNVAGYLAMVHEYAAGDGDTATEHLGAWPEREVAVAMGVAATTGSVRDLQAAAMLHTDFANRIIDTRPDAARLQLGLAEAALAAASSRIGQRQRLAPFVRRWYRFVASVYTSCELFPIASAVVHRGLDQFPDAAELFVARGVIAEGAVRKRLVADWRRDNIHGATNRDAVAKTLEQAEIDFRRALAIDSHNAEAHLHMGWVRTFLDEPGANTDLEAAIADAHNDRLRYLAHLFLGGLAERANHFDEARREYDSARNLGPEYQTPYAALSRVEQALGHDTRARELALIGVQLDKRDEDDPWWDHRIGFDRESLSWLRREVRPLQ